MEVDQMRLRKQTLQSVLQQCQLALEQLQDGADADAELCRISETKEKEGDTKEENADDADYDADELCDLLKSKVESREFFEKLGSMHMSIHHCNSVADESASWDMVSAKDLWEDKIMSGDEEFDQDGYVLVKQEDIVEGIACFMAAYLLSLEQAKELTPNQLQEALSKTFSVRKKKSKLQKAWDGSKVVYNVASWSATAIGIYQNPALFRATSMAFWTSCRVISKLL